MRRRCRRIPSNVAGRFAFRPAPPESPYSAIDPLYPDAKQLVRDDQLSFLLPQPNVDYMTLGPGDIYMFPRRDGILLGGSHERGDSRLEPDPATSERILRENGALFGGMRV
jgi:D-amino-acid oxidase